MAKLTTLLILLSVCLWSSQALKILLFSTGLSKSHAMFNYRLATVLTSHGHQVLVHTGPVFDEAVINIQPPEGIREIRQLMPKLTPEMAEAAARSRRSFLDDTWKPAKNGRLWDALKQVLKLNFLNEAIAESCLEDEHKLDRLRQENFDVVLAHHRSLCPLAVATVIEVEKFAWISISSYFTESYSGVMRIPIVSSYVPNAVGGFTDRMTLMERVENWLLHAMFVLFVNAPGNYVSTEDALFRKVASNRSRRVAPEARRGKSLLQIAEERVHTLFMNGEQALEIPRPHLPGMVYLGQLDAKNDVTKDLGEKRTKSYVTNKFLISVADQKRFLRMAFHDEKRQRWGDRIFDGHSGQYVLYAHGDENSGHVKLFITHGGYSSLLEAAQAGVPVMLIPLLNDQEGNAKRAVRLGIGLSLGKAELNGHSITKTMRSLLNDPGFAQRASRLPSFLNDRIVPSEDVWVKRVETIAKARSWPISKARKLTWFQMMCLDVIFASVLTAFAFCIGM